MARVIEFQSCFDVVFSRGYHNELVGHDGPYEQMKNFQGKKKRIKWI
jgi:hypothetical protein